MSARGIVVAVEDGSAASDRPERTVRALSEHELLDVTWSRYDAGQPGPDLHVHHEHVDAFFVVDGELRFRVGPAAAPVQAPPGTLVIVPPQVIHTFDNVSDRTARWLNFHAPSTGFIPSLRGERPGFDSHPAPADGGRPAAAATVTAVNGTGGRLGTEPQLSVSELIVAPGDGAGPLLDNAVAALFVLDGTVELLRDDTTVRAGTRTWLFAPVGVAHGYRNAGSTTARLLSLRAPG